MNQPLISVVMPVFNVEKYVGEAIQSVLEQTYENFELIIVDDGGTDESVAICRQFEDPRIRLVHQANRGLAGARNRGIGEGRGVFVALLDSDDRWAPDKLMLHAIHLTSNPSVDVSYSGSRLIDEAGSALRVAMQPKLQNVTAADIIARNPVGNGSAPVIRKTALEAIAFEHPRVPKRKCYFDENFRQSEDIECWLRLAIQGNSKFEGIAGLLTEYRVVSGALSSNVVRQFASWEEVLVKAESYAPDFVRDNRRRAKAYQLRYLARRAASMGDGPFSWSLIKQAITEFPSLFIEEPKKTTVTLLAGLAARFLKAGLFFSSGKALDWKGQRAMSKKHIVHLLNDFALGGVTKNLELFDNPNFSDQFSSQTLEVDPNKSIAPNIEADIICVHFPPSWKVLPFLYSLRARNPRVRIVQIEHSYNREWESINVAKRARFRAMLRLSLAIFDKIICVSNAQAEWLAEASGIKKSAIWVIYPWSNLDGLEQIKLPSFSRSKSIIIGAYGRFSDAKGFANLIHAMKSVRADRNIELVIGGFGEQESDLRRIAGISKNIHFYGRVDDVRHFMRGCDVVAIPSRFESFGLVASEAKMAGRPVLVSNVGGLPEQVRGSGMTINCSDQAAIILAIENLRNMPLVQMSVNAREDAIQMDAQRLPNWLDFFHQLVTRRSTDQDGASNWLRRNPTPIRMSAGQYK